MRLNIQRGIAMIMAVGLAAMLCAGCLENAPGTAEKNRSASVIALALNDSLVRENIPIDTGDYEIVEVGPVQYGQTGPKGNFSGTFTGVIFRCCGSGSLYHVIIDDENATVLSQYWQWVKEPLPCSGAEPPKEYSTLEEVSSGLSRGCTLAYPASVPVGYHLSLVREYGEPCPRQDIVYTSERNELRFVQVCPGYPPYAFAISGEAGMEIEIGDARGEFVRGVGQNQIAWVDEHGSYWLIGDLQKEDLLEVASSVKPFHQQSGAYANPQQDRIHLGAEA